MSFIIETMPPSTSNKRMTTPREWSPHDHYFYKQSIHQACHIGEIRSSLAYKIADIVKNTSSLTSDWKKIARNLGMNSESQLKDIEEAARHRQEHPLYVALTSQYMINPAASLGYLLNSLMTLKRYDILIKVKDDVRDIIREYYEQKVTSTSAEKVKKQPIEEESVESSSAQQNTVQDRNTGNNKSEPGSYHPRNYYSNEWHRYSDKENNADSAFYDRYSPPNSLLKILSKNDETMENNDNSIDCCHKSCEKDKKCGITPNWKERYQNKDNFEENEKILVTKIDNLGTTDFEFVAPTGKSQNLSSNINKIELNSESCSVCCDEGTETNFPSTEYINSSILTHTDAGRQSNTSTEEYYDSDTTYDDDFDPNLSANQQLWQEAFNVTNSCNQDTESNGFDNRRIENEKIQHLNIREYRELENNQFDDECDGTEIEAYDINNSVNERIENLVAKRNQSIRDVERAERESISVRLPLQEPQTMKKPQDHFVDLVSTLLQDSSIDVDRSIRIIIVHSDEDSATAIALARALAGEFHMAAVAECQLSPLWLLDPFHYKKAALYWADIIIPLITNTWLEDITNERPLSEREAPSLNARFVFRILQNMFSNRGCINLSSVSVVMEGTNRRFLDYPEIRDAIKLSRDFHADERMKYLGELIKSFHNISMEAKRTLLP